MHWLHFGDIESYLDQYFQGHLILKFSGERTYEMLK